MIYELEPFNVVLMDPYIFSIIFGKLYMFYGLLISVCLDTRWTCLGIHGQLNQFSKFGIFCSVQT
jgi:hypothetical protein